MLASSRLLRCSALFLLLLPLLLFTAASSISLMDLGYPGTFSAEEKSAFLTQSRAFAAQRAQEPFVHFFSDDDVFGSRSPPLGVLVQILQTAEEYEEARWNVLLAKGLVSSEQRRRRPVCAAGDEADAENEIAALRPELAHESEEWLRANAAKRSPFLEIHFNFTNCITPADVAAAFANFTVDDKILASQGFATSELVPVGPGTPFRVIYRVRSSSGLDKGLFPLVKMIPEGETWRVDLPPELSVGEGMGLKMGTWPTPPSCHTRYDVRVVRVHRGMTSLARCRQIITEKFGYDPYARDAAEREGRPSAGKAASAETVEEPGRAADEAPVTQQQVEEETTTVPVEEEVRADL